MPVCILHVGLPLDHALIPLDDRLVVARRLADLKQSMVDAGYIYEFAHVSPEDSLDAYRQRLADERYDGVLIGGGIAGDPELLSFMEQIVNTTHEVLPQAKIMFYRHAVAVRTVVERWFPSPAREHGASATADSLWE